MNILKIALFIFLVQEAVYIVAAANIPITCDTSGTSCLYFTADTISGTTWADIIANEVGQNQYKTTQLETDISADLWTATATALSIVTSIAYGSVFGIYSLIIFFFGNSAVSQAFGIVLQAVVYYFYAVFIIKMVKDVRGEV